MKRDFDAEKSIQAVLYDGKVERCRVKVVAKKQTSRVIGGCL